MDSWWFHGSVLRVQDSAHPAVSERGEHEAGRGEHDAPTRVEHDNAVPHPVRQVTVQLVRQSRDSNSLGWVFHHQSLIAVLELGSGQGSGRVTVLDDVQMSVEDFQNFPG